jgi:cytochrome c oxidase assembly protein subunit 11
MILPAMRTESKLTILAVAMFGFGYALVPLYDVFCEITGLNGKTGTIASTEAAHLEVDQERLVTVEFDTNVNSELPWSFYVPAHKMKVHPGALTDVVFIIENNSDQSVVAQAVPSVAPAQASLFFNKTECFCFTQQMLAPRERKEIMVRFVVDPDLPEKISTLTLSYTYFMAPGSDKIVQKPVIVDEERI